MKKTIITAVILATLATGVNAQILADAGDKKTEAATPTATVVKYVAPAVENASMNVQDNLVFFDNLPQRGEVSYYLTDANGNLLEKKTVSARRNSIDISKLKKGAHFITLESAFSGKRKAFMLSLQ